MLKEIVTEQPELQNHPFFNNGDLNNYSFTNYKFDREQKVDIYQRIKEIKSLIKGWGKNGISITQKAAELASWGTETKRETDHYDFYIKDGVLYSPKTGKPVADSINKVGYPDEMEYKVHLKNEKFLKENESGTSIWISPLLPSIEDYSDASKIIFSTITKDKKGRKVLRNRSGLIGFTPQECLEIYNIMSPSQKFSDPEKLRENTVVMDTKTAYQWMEFFAQLSNQFETEIDQKKIEENERKARIIFNNFPHYLSLEQQALYLYQQGTENKLIGKYTAGCGAPLKDNKKSASEVYSENSLDLNETFFDCPKCHRPIPSGKGITTCPHCGAKKEDYGSCI